MLGGVHVMWVHGVWMTLGCVVMDIHMEVACSLIARPCMDACVAFFLGAMGDLDNMMTFFMMHTWRVGACLEDDLPWRRGGHPGGGC
jgi:hypothetical protein